ncbi:MAG: hypothetical protein KKE89_05905 [Actinobacteria bacterium]|nr:hypothetical protein [Actinomycetota bacterium]
MALIMVSCADDNTTSPDNTVTLRVSGGINGIDENIVVHEDGRIVANDQPVSNPSLDEVAALFAQIRNGGFLTLESSYLPANTCCDRFTYQITAVLDGQAHSVTTMDATAEAPDELMLLIDSLLALDDGIRTTNP